jgi:NAD(P)-dependent dehydrogenase (short-subunit alcohol dehydrogenase family)
MSTSGLEGRHALVSGGGQGIRAAVARALAGQGACMTLLARRLAPLQQPDEVADAVRWLCGTGASAITGQAIAVCGGEITREHGR